MYGFIINLILYISSVGRSKLNERKVRSFNEILPTYEALNIRKLLISVDLQP